MRLNQVLLSLAAIMSATTFFIAVIVFSPVSAIAGTGDARAKMPPAASGKKAGDWPAPDVVYARPQLDKSDEIATLEAVQIALSDVGDGSSYVWHRGNGRLSGIVKPTSSFRDTDGKICRHLVLWLTSGTFSKKTEGIACRQADGVWSLEG